MFQWQRRHFLDELLRHDIEFETFNPLVFENPDEANSNLLNKATTGNYDLFISNMGYYKMLYVDTLEEIRRSGLPTLRIAWDNLMIPYIDEKLSKHFDLVWLTAKETEGIYKKWGVNYFFAPYAANPFTYNYNKPNMLKRTACFIGTPHGSRAFMINSLTKNEVRVDLYCGGIKNNRERTTRNNLKYSIINPSATETIMNRFRFSEGRKMLMGSFINRIKGSAKLDYNNYLVKHDGLPHEEMVETYSSAALAIAFTSAGHTDVLNTPLPIINLRNFEIPMCGGIELCKYNEELAGYFEEGKEIVFYNDNEELIDKANYYLTKASDEVLLKMKMAARMRAEKEHSWWNRFTIAFNHLGLRY